MTSGRCSLPPSQAVAELVGRDRDRREGRRRLGLEEAEALGELGRDQVAQRDVVDQHHQPDVLARRLGVHAHRHVVDDHRDLGLEVDAVRLVGQRDRRRRGPRKPSEPPWYISGSVQKLGGISAPRALRTSSTWLTIGRAVDPLVGARQRRRAAPSGRARTRRARRAVAQPLGAAPRAAARIRPVVERRLQGRRDVAGADRAREIAGDDDQACRRGRPPSAIASFIDSAACFVAPARHDCT